MVGGWDIKNFYNYLVVVGVFNSLVVFLFKFVLNILRLIFIKKIFLRIGFNWFNIFFWNIVFELK